VEEEGVPESCVCQRSSPTHPRDPPSGSNLDVAFAWPFRCLTLTPASEGFAAA
jgi:hypothetical protein